MSAISIKQNTKGDNRTVHKRHMHHVGVMFKTLTHEY